MNSMVIVESVDRSPPVRYAVVVLSNVLRKDSSELHKKLGADLHGIIESFHPTGGFATDATAGAAPAP